MVIELKLNFLDYRTFFGDPSEGLASFIEQSAAQLVKDLESFKKLAESDTFKESTLEPTEEITA